MDAAISAALDAVDGAAADVAAAVIGAAGVDRPTDRPVVEALLADRFPGRPILVVNDAELVLAAGTADRIGLALIAGTGSIVFARSAAGATVRAGGWGPLWGDEGSGYAIGQAAMAAVAHATDGLVARTALVDAVVAHFAVAEPSDLITQVYGRTDQVRALAVLAPLVVDLAAAGDTAAIEILDRQALALARAAVALVVRAGFGPCVPTAAGGGLLAGARVRGSRRGARGAPRRPPRAPDGRPGARPWRIAARSDPHVNGRDPDLTKPARG